MDLSRWVEAGATLVLAIIAGIQIARELKAPRIAQAAIDARVGPIAFLLRRQLRSWLAGRNDVGGGLVWWLDRASRSGSLKAHLDRAEKRAEELASLAPGASPNVRRGIGDAFVFLFSAGEAITRIGGVNRNTPVDDVFELLDAERDLRACIQALEEGPIPAYLANSDRILARAHEQENPFRLLADQLLRELPADDA